MMNPRPKRLLDAVREAIRRKHYSPRTEEAYLHWIRQFIRFYRGRHPREMGSPEIEAFLTHLAVNRHVAASTQNQALSALLFLYREVLGQELEDRIEALRAKRPQRLPAVLAREEVRRILLHLREPYRLMVQILYGSGLRLRECLSLRVKDLDFDRQAIVVRDAKGQKDRVTVLPRQVIPALREHLRRVKALHERDLRRGHGRVDLPFALERKYPNACREWGWQYVFPASRLSRNPRTGRLCRHHIHESALQKAVRKAARQAEIHKPVGCHTFRHSFATHLLEDGYDIRTVHQKMGQLP